MIFGDVPLKPEEIVKVLEREMPEVVKRIETEFPHLKHDGNTVWTLAVKAVLATLADEYKGQWFSTDKEQQKSEFMLDFVWWEHSEGGDRAILGCESEWGNPRYTVNRHIEVAADFEKLLSFKAPVKLLVFEAANSTMREQIHSEIRRCGTNFAQHVEGECYLFVEFSHGTSYSHVYRVGTNGKLPDFNPFR